jgi:hypothetical protein
VDAELPGARHHASATIASCPIRSAPGPRPARR